MHVVALAPIDPWRIEIIAVVGGARTSSERAAISRDAARGRLLRIRPGAYVERIAFESLSPEQQHIVRIRAAAAVAPGPILVSHWSAAVVLGKPVLRSRLGSVHITVAEDDDRHRHGLTAHRFPVADLEVIERRGLFVTSIARTVVDVAGAAPIEEGVMLADAVLRSGVQRAQLEAAIEIAGPRRAVKRIGQVVQFGHPGAESPAESRFRVTSMRLGLEVPELQHRLVLSGGEAFLDAWYRSADVGVEIDGEQKYLDAAMAPEGAGRAVIFEKRREDQVRLQLSGLARIGWVQSGSATALRPILHRLGVDPPRRRTTILDYIEAARDARPRHRA